MFFSLLIFIIFEFTCKYAWIPFYYKYWVPVSSRKIIINKIGSIKNFNISKEYIILSKEFLKNDLTPIKFYILDENTIIFRRMYRYFDFNGLGLFTGIITYYPKRKEVIVKGHILISPILILLVVLGSSVFLFPIEIWKIILSIFFGLGLMLLMYFIDPDIVAPVFNNIRNRYSK